MRISNYDDFSPFKRSHQISKKVPKVEEDIQAYKNISENSRVKWFNFFIGWILSAFRLKALIL